VSVPYRFTSVPPLEGGITLRQVLELKRAVGGTAAGSAVLAVLAASCDELRTPVVRLARPADDTLIAKGAGLSRVSLESLADRSWAVKYSGSQESFSRYSARGRQSSNGKTLPAGTGEPRSQARLDEIWRLRPPGTRYLLLQEFLDLREPHSLIYMDIEPDTTWIEVVEGLNRLLITYSSAGAESYRESAGPGRVRLSARDLSRLAKCGTVIRASLERVLPRTNVEALYFDESRPLELLQLRPTPRDRPARSASGLPVNTDAEVVWSTRFTWGVFRVVVKDWVARYPDGAAIIQAETDRSPATGSRLFAAFDGPLCIIDTVSGFRLTHEPWNLPPYDKREGYAFAYVPSRILELSSNSRIEIAGDGDTAVVFKPTRPGAHSSQG